MLKNNSNYKNFDFLNENFRERMINYFNPYEYNFESNNKDKGNSDLNKMKSKDHLNRKINKNK